jgi:hypothetical protein
VYILSVNTLQNIYSYAEMTNNLKATGPRIEAEGVVDGEVKLRLWFSRKKGREEWESLNKESFYI